MDIKKRLLMRAAEYSHWNEWEVVGVIRNQYFLVPGEWGVTPPLPEGVKVFELPENLAKVLGTKEIFKVSEYSLSRLMDRGDAYVPSEPVVPGRIDKWLCDARFKVNGLLYRLKRPWYRLRYRYIG